MEFIHLEHDLRLNINNVTHYFKNTKDKDNQDVEYQVKIFIIGRKKPLVLGFSHKQGRDNLFRDIDQLIAHCKMTNETKKDNNG